MNIALFLSIISLSTSLYASVVAEEPEVFNKLPDTLYTPVGFDNNDNSQVVFEGILPSSCYQTGLLFKTVDMENKKIYFRDTAHYYPNRPCLRVILPYFKEPNLGMLEIGDYEIFFKNSDEEWVPKGLLNVKQALNEAPDDELYAPVSHVNFQRKTDDQPAKLVLLGELTNDCMSFDRIDLQYVAGRNTVNVLPVVKIDTSDLSQCGRTDEAIPYRQEVPLDTIEEGRYLFHIRSMNGKAVNRIIQVK